MQITRVYSDGSFTKIYERGDKVKVVDNVGWLIERKELAEVTDSGTDILEIQTESMKRGGWHPISVSPESIEPYGKTLLQVPYLIQKWKEKQVKTLLVGETYATNG